MYILAFKEMVKTPNFRFDENDVSSVGWKALLRNVFKKGVSKKTRKQYRGRLLRYVNFVADKGLVLGKESVLRFIAVLWRQGAAGGTIEGHRSAIVYAQRANGMEESAGDRDVLRITKAMVHITKSVRTQRAAITLKQLDQLCSLDEKYAYAFKVGFFGILRLKQLKKVRCGDFEAGSEPTLLVRRDKRCRQGRRPRGDQKHRKEVLFGELGLILEPMQELFEAGTRMFDWVDENRARALVKRAARVFKWPRLKINYDGFHCCRHGGAREAKLRVLFAAERCANGAAMARGTFAGYSRANRVRARGLL